MNAFAQLDQHDQRSMPPDDRFGPAPNPFTEDPAPRVSRFYSASDLEGLEVPPRHWLVRDLVPSGTVTILGGDGGTGKSLLALQLACAVATNGNWLERQVSGGGVLFISAEDDNAELHRRLSDVVRGAGQRFSDLDRLTIRSLAGEDALLAHLDRSSGVLAPSPLYTELDKRLDDEKPALVVLDTLADLFPGNENDRAQARHFIGLLRGLAIRYDCAVVVLAHPSLSGMSSGTGTSGSTGWNNSVRSRLYLERVAVDGIEMNPDARVLSTKKANYGRTGGEISLTWRDGVFVADPAETALDRMAGNAKAERVFIKLLREFSEQGRRVNDKGSTSYAPKMFSEHPNSENVTKRAFKAAMDSLLASGKVRIDTEGPASRRVSYLVEAGT